MSLTLSNLLRTTAQTHGRRVAIRDDAGTWTWNEYVERIARTAGMLRALGLGTGERFAILARNSVPHAELMQAGYWSGIVPVPLNFRLAPPEIAQMLADAQCKVLFVDDAMTGLLDHEALAPWRAHALGLAVDGPARGLPDAAQQVRDASAIERHEGREDDDALILFTGGTTGRSKGVRLSHRNIISNALQLANTMGVCEDDVYLHVSPMFHSSDLKSTVVSLFGGGHVYLKDFSAQEVLEKIDRHRVSIVSLVPTTLARLQQEGRFDAVDLSSLRLVTYGSSPMDAGVLREAMRTFAGAGFHQCYGMTETAPFITVLDAQAHRRAITDRPDLHRSAGRPLPATELRFLDGQGREVPAGEPGEIVARGPQVSRGYINAPSDGFQHGWFHTGDIGRMDEDGYLYVLGRLKEMVITGGENVYVREVEQVLEQHPGVREVAVVGVPDAQYGEALLAAIVPAGDAPTAQELIGFCRGRLGGFKIPRQYLFLEALPRTTLGKVRRQDLQVAWAHRTTQGTLA